MKSTHRIVRWVGLAALVGLACALSPKDPQSGDTKPFKEAGLEYFVTGVIPGSLQHPFFQEMRAQWGRTEDWSGVILQTSQNNVGGQGSGLAMECVYWDETGKMTVYGMKYEVLANGDKLAMAGRFEPRADGSLEIELNFLPAECTGRFAGATGAITSGRPTPGPGYVFEGTITTVGATKP